MKSKKANFVGFVVMIVIVIIVFLLDGIQESAPSSVSNPPKQRQASSGLIPAEPWPPLGEAGGLKVSDQPLATNYYVILDASGSMQDRVAGAVKMDAAKSALDAFSKNVPDSANVGLLTFSPERQLLSIAPHKPSNFSSVIQAVSAGGGTPLVSSVKKGFEALSAQATNQGGYGRYILLIVTDGESSDGDPSSLARDIVYSSAIEVHVIGFGLEQHALKMPGVTEYYVANSIDDLIQALESVVSSESESFLDPNDFSFSL